MRDNLVSATNKIRNSTTSLKRKLSKIKISIEELDIEIEAIDAKFDRLVSEADIFKSKIERELGREVRRLEKELLELRKSVKNAPAEREQSDPEILTIASTMSVLECILREMCKNADDFRLMSYATLFPSVMERVCEGREEAYFLDALPSSTGLVIERGKQYLEWVRSECDTYLTDPASWERYSEEVSEWWRNDALPLLYGSRDKKWDIDVPLTLNEMLVWKNSPADRPEHFPVIFDAYEIYRKYKDEVYESSGVRDFEFKLFANGGDHEV